MNRDEAIAGLKARELRTRLDAAKFFVAQGNVDDLNLLRDARRSESDAYVRKRLDQAIGVVEESDLPIEAELDSDIGVIPEAASESRAVQWVGRMLLHEIEGPLGRLSLYAPRETREFSSSNTKRELESLRSVFRSVGQLVRVTQAPEPTEFDLAALIKEVASNELEGAASYSIFGEAPFLIVSDQDFLRLAVCNGIRNAKDAVQGRESGGLHDVVVTWGKTNVDYWISVIDNGAGLPSQSGALFDLGVSNKAGHRGLGLPIARMAMTTLRGTVELRRAATGGAQYELRWAREP